MNKISVFVNFLIYWPVYVLEFISKANLKHAMFIVSMSTPKCPTRIWKQFSLKEFIIYMLVISQWSLSTANPANLAAFSALSGSAFQKGSFDFDFMHFIVFLTLSIPYFRE